MAKRSISGSTPEVQDKTDAQRDVMVEALAALESILADGLNFTSEHDIERVGTKLREFLKIPRRSK